MKKRKEKLRGVFSCPIFVQSCKICVARNRSRPTRRGVLGEAIPPRWAGSIAGRKTTFPFQTDMVDFFTDCFVRMLGTRNEMFTSRAECTNDQ